MASSLADQMYAAAIKKDTRLQAAAANGSLAQAAASAGMQVTPSISPSAAGSASRPRTTSAGASNTVLRPTDPGYNAAPTTLPGSSAPAAATPMQNTAQSAAQSAAQSGSGSAPAAASKTTYIDANGNRKTGYIIGGATYEDMAGTTPVGVGSIVNTAGGQYIKTENGSMLYSDYLKNQGAGGISDPRLGTTDAAGRYYTTVTNPDGSQELGYIQNGTSYYASDGRRIADGASVVAANGTVYTKGASTYDPDYYNGASPNWLEKNDFGSPTAGGLAKAGYVPVNSDEFLPSFVEKYGEHAKDAMYMIEGDRITIDDVNGNWMATIDSAGNVHLNTAKGSLDDSFKQAYADAVKNYLLSSGYRFTGDGSEWGRTTPAGSGSATGGRSAGASGAIGTAAGSGKGTYGGTTAAPAVTAQPARTSAAPAQDQQLRQAEEAERLRQAEEAERLRLEEELRQAQQAAQLQQVEPQANAQMAQLQEQLQQVDALLEEARAANDAAYALQLEQVRNRIQLQISNLNEQYQGLNRQLYIDYMMAKRDMPQLLSAQGYTGGLRESSLIGLQTGYEGQLAENERQRLAGIREIESGGLDRELTLGIENAKAQRESGEQAYDRASAVRAAMLQQMNRIEDLSREDAATARREAQKQIDSFVAAGGTLSQIPQQLLSISGYSPGYVQTLSRQYQQEQARAQADAIVRAGGTVPDSIAAAAGYDMYYTGALDAARARQEAQAQAEAIVRAGGTVPASIAAAAGYDATYTSALAAARARQEAQAQADAILRAGGTLPASIAAAAGYDTTYTGALDAARARQEAQAQADAILKAGGTVPGSIGTMAGYGQEYLDALSGQTGKKPVLTAAQVNDAIKRGVVSQQVLDAYEYYYGVPYQQASYTPTPYTADQPYTPPAQNPTPQTQTTGEWDPTYAERQEYWDNYQLAPFDWAAATSASPAASAKASTVGQGIQNLVASGNYEGAMRYADLYTGRGDVSAEEARSIVGAAVVDDLIDKVRSGAMTQAAAEKIIQNLGI